MLIPLTLIFALIVQFAVLYAESKYTMSVDIGTPLGDQFAAVFQLLPDVGFQYLVLAGIVVGVAV